MIVVSDTTPLRYLAVLGQLELLPRLFGRVHCPSAVIQECLHPRAPEELRSWASNPPNWLIINEVAPISAELASALDIGEAAALTLAQSLHADVVLIDELDGRRQARALGFTTAGTLNILAQAGRRGWIDFFAVTEQLKSTTNFRTTQSVIDAAWLTST